MSAVPRLHDHGAAHELPQDTSTQSTMSYWAQELQDFRDHVAAGGDYLSWQPTKWQSLESLRDRLLAECWGGAPGPGASALELGCGSATLLLQLQEAGVQASGIDRDPGALTMAQEAAASMRIPVPDLQQLDFDLDDLAAVPRADLVFHIGVIEHLSESAQLDLLQLSARLSRRWVLVAIPHVDGPVFSGFLRAVTAEGTVYDDDHEHIDVEALVARTSFRMHHVDGLHLFYSSPKFYSPGDPTLDALYDRLRLDLVHRGGPRYQDFPHLPFTPADIPLLRAVEDAVGSAERYAAGFLRYYLIDTQPEAAHPA